MKILLSGGNRPLFACALFLSILFGCRKDSPLPSEEIAPAPPAAQLPISVDEAFAFFPNLDLRPANTLGGDGTHPMVSISPLWAQAFVGHSPSGREIVTVPLADTSLRALNHGRADAKLLFSKTGQDSIEAQVLVWVADSAHWAAQGGALNFNTFTGAYLFFDLGFHFQYDVGVLAGTPVALVDSIGHGGGQQALDREEVPCVPTIDFFKVCEDDTPPPTEQAFTLPADNCWTTVWIWFDCSQGGGGGGGGGGGTTNPAPTITYWNVFSGQIPVEIFLGNGGTLPPGFDQQLFRQLVDIVQAYHLSANQVNWLMSHTGFIPVIWDAGESGAMIVPVLNFAMAHNLAVSQYQFLIKNPTVFQSIQFFLTQHPGDSKAAEIVNALLLFIQDLADLTLSDLNFLYDNFDGIEEVTSQPLLVMQIANFLQSHEGNEPAKLFAKYIIQELHTDPSIPINTDLSQYNFFDDFDPVINYLESNTEPEGDVDNGIDIDYIIQAPPSPPSAGRLLGGAPENPNGGQDAIGRTDGDINILPAHLMGADSDPEWLLKLRMKNLFFMATNGDVNEILDGMGDAVRDAYLNNFFGNKNGTFLRLSWCSRFLTGRAALVSFPATLGVFTK